MRLCGIGIRNFRSIEEADITVGDMTRIIGANGAGKSTILKALEMFYGKAAPTLTPDDFFNREQGREIEIILSFKDLSEQERERFGSQVKLDGTLSVTRMFSINSKTSGRYYGSAMRCTDFAGVRAVDKASEKREQYNIIRADRCPDLPAVTRADDIEPALQSWEAAHPERCTETRDDGQFFGFQNVARGKLGDSTMLVHIPAVRDVSGDIADSKNTAVARLLELVVKSEIERRPDIRKFKEETDQRFREIMNPANLTELGRLAGSLSETLASFYAHTAVLLNWRDPQPLTIQFPAADMTLDDDGFVSAVDRTGHGLQRALIITLLQHLAVASQSQSPGLESEQSSPEAAPAEQSPSLVLAIEEPELYQHPTKQRHFSEVLKRLSAGQIPGVARHTQVLFTTHSPIFVSMERFEEVTLVRRIRRDEKSPRSCSISTADLHYIAKKVASVWGYDNEAFTAASLKPRLHVVDGATAEGFFSAKAVLVEGVSDRAALIAAALRRNIDLAAEEVAIIPVGGKSTLDKPFLIFRELGIPTFVMWDCDADKGKNCQANVNRALQRMVGIPEPDLRDTCHLLGTDHACFEVNLEAVLSAEIGTPLWENLLDGLREKYGVSGRDDAQKIPQLMLELLCAAAEKGAFSPTLDGIIDAIVALTAPQDEPAGILDTAAAKGP